MMHLSNSGILKYSLLLSLFGTSGFAMAGGFSASCSNIHLNGSWLSADCGNGHGRRHSTQIDLNRYITNSWGNFSWKQDGNYNESAINCGVNTAGTLYCQLGDGHGGWPQRSIDLNEHITNSWGNLTYD